MMILMLMIKLMVLIFSMLMTRRSVMLRTLTMLLMSLMTMLLMLMTKRLVSALASAPPCTASQSAQGRFPGDNNNNDHPDYHDNDSREIITIMIIGTMMIMLITMGD